MENVVADSISRIKIQLEQNIEGFNVSENELNLFECHICHKKFITKSSLKQHEGNSKLHIKCPQFDLIFTQKNHVINVNKNHTTPENEEMDYDNTIHRKKTI